MTRTGHPHGRSTVFVAALMAMLALAAGVLLSDGSGHHVNLVHAAQTVAPGAEAGVMHAADHDRIPDGELAPAPGQRLRPAAGTALLAVDSTRPGPVDLARVIAADADPGSSGDRLTSLTVLRI